MKPITKGKKLKKQLVVAVTAALLAFPFSATLVLAETSAQTTTSIDSVSTETTETTSGDTTATDVVSGDADSTASTSADTTSTDESSTDVAATDNTSPETTDSDDEDTDTNSEGATNSEDQDTDNEDTESTTVVDADGNEIDPANWLSDLIGKLKLALTFDPARKAELTQKQALEKLAKSQKLMTDGEAEESEKAFTEYADKITKAQEFLEQIEDPNSEEAQKLTIALTNVNQNNIKVLGNLLEKLPPQAAQKLALNVVRSMEKAVTKMEKQEAKIAAVAAEGTGEDSTESEVGAAAHNKALKKEAKVALKEFKKTLKENGKLQLEDDQDSDQDQNSTNEVAVTEPASSQEASLANTQPTSVTIAPASVESSSTVDRSSKKEKAEQNKKDDNENDKAREKSDNKKQEKQKSEQ